MSARLAFHRAVTITLAFAGVSFGACGSERASTPNPGVSGVAWFEQNWDYSSTAQLKSAVYEISEANGGVVSLQTIGVEGGQSNVNKALRATYSTSQQSYAGVSLLPSNYNVTKPREVWVEIYVRFDNAWFTQSDDKTFFYLEDHSQAGGPNEVARWETHIVSMPLWYGGPSGAVGNTIPDYFGNANVQFDPWDGNWHRLRHHLKMSSTPTAKDGVYKVWWDDTVVIDQPGIATNSPTKAFFRNITLGANADPAGSGIRDWGRVRVFTSNPGW